MKRTTNLLTLGFLFGVCPIGSELNATETPVNIIEEVYSEKQPVPERTAWSEKYKSMITKLGEYKDSYTLSDFLFPYVMKIIKKGQDGAFNAFQNCHSFSINDARPAYSIDNNPHFKQGELESVGGKQYKNETRSFVFSLNAICQTSAGKMQSTTLKVVPIEIMTRGELSGKIFHYRKLAWTLPFEIKNTNGVLTLGNKITQGDASAPTAESN
jgi:hypothetical protein